MDKQIEEFENYLRNVKKTKENTVLSYLRDLRILLEAMERRGIYDAKDITEDVLSSFFAGLKEEHRANSSVIRNYTSIRSFFRYLVDNGDITENPAENLHAPRAEKKKPRILNEKEVGFLLAQEYTNDPKGKRDRAILELLYATGLRTTELVALKLSNIDMSLGCLRMDDKRLIPYGAKAKDALNDYFLYGREHYIKKINKNSLKEQELVFLNYNGEAMSRQGLWKLIKGYVKKAGIDENITPYTLRHSFAKHLIDSGADASAVQEIMGYTDVSTVTRLVPKDRKNKDPYSWARLRNNAPDFGR